LDLPALEAPADLLALAEREAREDVSVPDLDVAGALVLEEPQPAVALARSSAAARAGRARAGELGRAMAGA
jgi:hypothetical protein